MITIGNDTFNDLIILSGGTRLGTTTDNPKTNISRVIENEVTVNIKKNLGNGVDSAENAISLNNPNVEIWYNSTIDSTKYAELVYLEQNNIRWMHYQYYLGVDLDILPIIQSIERVSGSKTVKYTAPSAGTYTFKVTDSFGNESTKSITVE